MDPLSVSASIIGILGAAAKVSSVLIAFVKNTTAAPKLAQTVLAHVNGLSTVLSHLQTYLLGTAAPTRSRASLILVEQVLVTLAECVATFSELEDVLDTSKHNTEMDILDRIKWAKKESKVADIQQRLQSNKSSLALMLTILQCKSMEEAESAMTRLCGLVEQVLATNQEMGRRLRNMDDKPVKRSHSPGSNREDDASTNSGKTITLPPGLPRGHLPENVHRSQFGFSFEEDLLASRVYHRPLLVDSCLSLVTSAARTTASSILSALSLTDVSNISILAVPVYADEISNQDRYTFGDSYWELSGVSGALSQQAPAQSQEIALKTNRWERFAHVVSRRRLDKVPNLGASQEPIQPVLGISLSEVVKTTNVVITLDGADVESFVYGYIPVYIAKIGSFLKKKGLNVGDIFCISGSPLRLRDLQDSFNKPPGYGIALDWSGYTVHDAASIMLRFLNRLPEPVVPFERYEAFRRPLKRNPLDWDWTAQSPAGWPWTHEHKSLIEEYKSEIALLPGESRHLLSYLLQLFSLIASHSESNKMTSWRIAKIFQPVILSPVKAGEYFHEDTFPGLSQQVLTVLIESVDVFLFTEDQFTNNTFEFNVERSIDHLESRWKKTNVLETVCS